MSSSGTLSQVLFPGGFIGIGDILDQEFPGEIDSNIFEFFVSALGGYEERTIAAAEDDCFFPTVNACVAPTWALTAGNLPAGVILSSTLGLIVLNSSVALVYGSGLADFTVTLTDGCGFTSELTYHPELVAPSPPWPPGVLIPPGTVYPCTNTPMQPCPDTTVPGFDPETVDCGCPANSTTIADIANWAAVGKLKRWDILPDAIEAAVDVYRGVCGKVPFDILRHISPEFLLTAGQAAYSLSCFNPAVLGIISVRLTYGPNKFRRMRRSDGRVYDSLGSLISSIPATYARFGSNIEFNPMPSGGSQTYRLRYWSAPPIDAVNPGNTILVTPPDWDELFKWETLYRMYIHLDMFEKAQALVNPVGMQRQQSPKRTIMFETAIIPRLWNDLLLTISQRENIDEDFSINPLIRNYTRT